MGNGGLILNIFLPVIYLSINNAEKLFVGWFRWCIGQHVQVFYGHRCKNVAMAHGNVPRKYRWEFHTGNVRCMGNQTGRQFEKLDSFCGNRLLWWLHYVFRFYSREPQAITGIKVADGRDLYPVQYTFGYHSRLFGIQIGTK